MSRFTDAIERNLDGLHIATGAAASCPECISAYDISNRDARGRFRSVDAMQAELSEMEHGHFSWHECDSCGSSLGGDRHEAHAWTHGFAHELHLHICTDCLMYHANGDEPEEWYASPREARNA